MNKSFHFNTNTNLLFLLKNAALELVAPVSSLKANIELEGFYSFSASVAPIKPVLKHNLVEANYIGAVF